MFCVPRSVPYTQQALNKLFFLNKSIKYTGKYNLVCGTPIIFLRKLIKMRRRNLKKNQGKMRFELIDKWRERDSESMAEVSV